MRIKIIFIFSVQYSSEQKLDKGSRIIELQLVPQLENPLSLTAVQGKQLVLQYKKFLKTLKILPITA